MAVIPSAISELPELDQVEAERLDLRENAEQGGLILERAGEHGLAALQLGRHRGKGGQGGLSEPAPYPDRVQARRGGHGIIVDAELGTRRCPNLVIVRAAAALVRVRRRKNGCARRAWRRCDACAC